MADLPCNLNEIISAHLEQEVVNFRTDVLLAQPILLGPRDQAVICLKSNRFSNSNIALNWAAVTGATLYVLQWGTDAQMQGPSVRQVITASTSVAMTRDEQVRLGETYYWRVFALNISGGVSPPSETRQFSFNCPEGSDASTNSDLFNIEAEIIGPTTIRSCEDTTFYVKLSFIEKDANERTICTFLDCVWESSLLEGGGTIVSPAIFGEPLMTIVNLTTPTMTNAEIKATLSFRNEITSEEFTKELVIEAIAEPFTFGCGLKCVEECVDDDPAEKTLRTALDFDGIVGEGLQVYRNDVSYGSPYYGSPYYGEAYCACPKIGLKTCDDTQGLMIGSYPAIAGGDIAGWATGPIIYRGKIHEVKNHSKCPVSFGDPVGYHISPNCEKFFVPCVCCEEVPPTPHPDCDTCVGPFHICVAGHYLIMSLNNYDNIKYVSIKHKAIFPPNPDDVDNDTACCPDFWCYRINLRLRVFCKKMSSDPNVYEPYLSVTSFCQNPMVPATGVANTEFSLASLCANPETVLDELFSVTNYILGSSVPEDCEIPIKISGSFITECESECETDEPTIPTCCNRSLWFCINEVSRQMPLAGGNETFDVGACCDCPGGASLQLTTQCVNGVPVLGWFYQCAEITGSGTISLAHFCTSDSPQILTIDDPCFIQIQVTVEEQICAECLYTPTTGTTEPPPIDP